MYLFIGQRRFLCGYHFARLTVELVYISPKHIYLRVLCQSIKRPFTAVRLSDIVRVHFDYILIFAGVYTSVSASSCANILLEPYGVKALVILLIVVYYLVKLLCELSIAHKHKIVRHIGL